MKKNLYENLASCKKEEELKAAFCAFFKMKIKALGNIDHYTEQVLFEFKYDRNFSNLTNIAAVLAQIMYYARMLKSGTAFARYPLPPVICVIDKNEAFFAETKQFAKFYASKSARYDWDRAASTPCPNLVADISAYLPVVKPPYVYDLTKAAEEEQFISILKKYLSQQQFDFLDILEKKNITEDNFLDVYEYWNGLFENYVRNGRKSSVYFLADIEEGKSIDVKNGQVLFSIDGVEGMIPKTIQPKDYAHFWQNYEKVPSKEMPFIRQKADRMTEDFRRRFTGEFYTPIEFASKGLEYLERTIGKNWWQSGKYRFWDMAAGTGNLEFPLPSSALKYCYISTLDEEDAKYCQKIFPDATCFQYDYLADDIDQLTGIMTYGMKYKMPPNLVADLANPELKWIIFINPPFATANTVGGETGKKSKDTVSQTTIRKWMNDEKYGEASRELFTQFLFRISKEFKDKEAHLCLFSKLKYLNSNNDQKIRDGFFQYTYKCGFIFPIQCFYGAKGNFPVGFLVWDLSKRKHLKTQEITIDVFNANIEKIGTKTLPSVERIAMLNKWCPRPKWDGHSVMPMFSSGLSQQMENKDQRDHIAKGYLFSVVSKGDDFQNQNSVFILSSPYANAGAFSVTEENFEKAMVLHAVKKLPKATWTNDRDVFYAPTKELSQEFIDDCILWSSFADSNDTVSLRNVPYKGKIYQIINNLYPFLLNEIRQWPCSNGDITTQMVTANEDRYLAKWLAGHTLSKEASTVMSAAKKLYQTFYAELINTRWMQFKIETWDVGIYQVRAALKDAGLGATELAALKSAQDALRSKLLPQVYSLGFLNPDVVYFE